MINDERTFRERNKFWLQTAAFLLLILPPMPLYGVLQSGPNWLIWPLMLSIYLGALLGLWAS
jgi:hypothetical protein